jgi:hypothetical protein
MDMLEDIKTLTQMLDQANKWKADNGRGGGNTGGDNGGGENIPPPLGSQGEVNINADTLI